MRDLFGNEVAFDPQGPALTPKERRKLKHGRTTTLPRGHAAPPGSGPAGETCKGCAHYVRLQYHDYVHLKCEANRARWTRGPGSDIRAKDPACKLWEKAT